MSNIIDSLVRGIVELTKNTKLDIQFNPEEAELSHLTLQSSQIKIYIGSDTPEAKKDI